MKANESKRMKCFGYEVIVFQQEHCGREAAVAKYGTKKAYAYCHPTDLFDFDFGAKLAACRLVKGLIKEESKAKGEEDPRLAKVKDEIDWLNKKAKMSSMAEGTT